MKTDPLDNVGKRVQFVVRGKTRYGTILKYYEDEEGEWYNVRPDQFDDKEYSDHTVRIVDYETDPLTVSLYSFRFMSVS